MTLDVPGIGTLSNIIFSIDPGKPMYITPSLSATTFSFTLKDRYGNISPDTLSANITRDTDPSVPVNFTNGIYSDLRKTGYYTIKAPSLEKNTFSYSDTSGTYTLTGISYASLYVPPAEDSFSFLPDYNARYTILA